MNLNLVGKTVIEQIEATEIPAEIPKTPPESLSENENENKSELEPVSVDKKRNDIMRGWYSHCSSTFYVGFGWRILPPCPKCKEKSKTATWGEVHDEHDKSSNPTTPNDKLRHKTHKTHKTSSNSGS